MTLFYTSQQQQQQQNHNLHTENLNNITQRTTTISTSVTSTSPSSASNMFSTAGDATSVNTTVDTTPDAANLTATSTTTSTSPTKSITTDLPDIIAPFPKKFLYAYASHLLNNGNNNNFISNPAALHTITTNNSNNNNNDDNSDNNDALLQLQQQHRQQSQQLQQQLQQQKLQLQQLEQKLISPATTTSIAVTNDGPWGLPAVQEDSEDDHLGNKNNNNGDALKSISDEALACAELMEIMGNSSRGSSKPVSLSGSPDQFNDSNAISINKSTTKSMEELKIYNNDNINTDDYINGNDENENTLFANRSNSYDEVKAIEIEKMRQRPFTISTSILTASSTTSSASGSTTTSPTTTRPSHLAVDNSHLLFGSSPITRAHNPLPMDSFFSLTKQRSKQFQRNNNQQQFLRPTSLYQTNYNNNNNGENVIEEEINFHDRFIENNNENALGNITTSNVGGISRMINNSKNNSFENVSKVPHNLSKTSKTAIFMSISEGGRRRSLSVGSASLKTGNKIIGC